MFEFMYRNDSRSSAVAAADVSIDGRKSRASSSEFLPRNDTTAPASSGGTSVAMPMVCAWRSTVVASAPGRGTSRAAARAATPTVGDRKKMNVRFTNEKVSAHASADGILRFDFFLLCRLL